MERGVMNATELLRDDHERIRGLLERLKLAWDKEELLPKVEKEIRIHSQLEESLFYPEVREVKSIWVDAALDTHQHIEALLEDLIDAVDEEDEFEQKLIDLEAHLDTHLEDEETNIFPRVEEQLEEQLDELGSQLYQMRSDLEEEWREAA
jgi:hemerythrin superfamily protein